MFIRLQIKKMVHIVIFGAPGSGKGTQSEKIIEKYGFAHISTGELLREEIAHDTEAGRIAKERIDKGQLAPDDLTFAILANHLNEIPDAKGVVFDGFPRTVAQAKKLNALVESYNSSVNMVINLVVNEAELINRILQRSKTSGRSDDNLETIEKRLITYHSKTEPLLDFYKNEGKLVNIQGEGTVDEIFARVCEAMEEML